MKRVDFLRFWSVAVGAMDALTGILLMFAPGLVVRMLGVAAPSTDALVFLSWIGVFVTAVGLSYALALGAGSVARRSGCSRGWCGFWSRCFLRSRC